MRTFHDAVIVSVNALEDTVTIALENVSLHEGSECFHESGKLVVEGTAGFTEKGVPVSVPPLGYEDGQILKLRMDEQHLSMLVEWASYARRVTDVGEYEISGSAVRWLPESRHLEHDS